MIKLKCMLDKQKFNKKPTGFETAGIQKRLSQVEINIEELANLLTTGCTFKPALLNGTKSEDWLSQQLFALDFDGNTTIQEELDRCEQLSILPIFGYTSFSHTDNIHKFRLVFMTDNIITDRYNRNKLQITLIKTFSNSDQVTFDCTRLFYGGRMFIYSNYNNRINYDYIINNYYKEEYTDECIIKVAKVAKVANSSKREKGVQDITDINIPSLSCTPFTPLPPEPILEDNTYNIKAIADNDLTYLKYKYNIKEKKVFDSFYDFQEYIMTNINLSNLLEIKYPASFRCIFHKDHNPSASIFINEKGHYIYKCHSSKCGESYNIIGIVEVLGKFKSRPKTYKFIKDIFNLEIVESDWQKEQREILSENIRQLDDGELDEKCMQTMKNINNIRHYLDMMHKIATRNVCNEELIDSEGNTIFFASIENICRQMGMSPNSLNKISQKLVVLAYHKLINKLDDNEIPDKYLNKSKHISIDPKNKYKNHISWFSIPAYTYNLYPKVEDAGEKWKDNKYTMKGVSREMFYRTEGLDVANKLYPQYKKVTENGEVVDRTTTEASDNRTNNIIKVIISLIEDYGYATEPEIIQILKCKYAYETTQIQIKKSLKDIMDSYGLERLKCNKLLKEKYKIESKGYPFIIVKNVNNSCNQVID